MACTLDATMDNHGRAHKCVPGRHSMPACHAQTAFKQRSCYIAHWLASWLPGWAQHLMHRAWVLCARGGGVAPPGCWCSWQLGACVGGGCRCACRVGS